MAFYSKKLTTTEARYHVTDRELLATYQSYMKWRKYLHGHKYTIFTDHKPLVDIATPECTSRMIAGEACITGFIDNISPWGPKYQCRCII